MDRKTGLSEIIREGQDKVYFSEEEIKSLVKKNGYVFVGKGSESLVIHPKLKRAWWQVLSPPQKPATVLAIEAFGSHYSPEAAVNMFYNHRIMSTLFPHNFPRFTKSWSGYEVFIDEQVKKVSGTERTYIEAIETNKETGWQALDLKAKYPFQPVANAIIQIGLPFYTDDTSGNFGLAKDGGVYYLDRIATNFMPFSKRVKNNIDQYMLFGNYSSDDIHTVQMSVNRIQTNGSKR